MIDNKKAGLGALEFGSLTGIQTDIYLAAVWPFLTGWVALAHFNHGFLIQGYESLISIVRHTFDNALGCVTELFSGEQNIWPGEAVPHQGFSSAGLVLPLVRGLLGLESEAAEKRIVFEPRFPADWDEVSINNYRVLGPGTKVLGAEFKEGQCPLN